MTSREQEQRSSQSNPNQKSQDPGAQRGSERQQQAQMPGHKGGQPQQGGQHNPQRKGDQGHGQR